MRGAGVAALVRAVEAGDPVGGVVGQPGPRAERRLARAVERRDVVGVLEHADRGPRRVARLLRAPRLRGGAPPTAAPSLRHGAGRHGQHRQSDHRRRAHRLPPSAQCSTRRGKAAPVTGITAPLRSAGRSRKSHALVTLLSQSANRIKLFIQLDLCRTEPAVSTGFSTDCVERRMAASRSHRRLERTDERSGGFRGRRKAGIIHGAPPSVRASFTREEHREPPHSRSRGHHRARRRDPARRGLDRGHGEGTAAGRARQARAALRRDPRPQRQPDERRR